MILQLIKRELPAWTTLINPELINCTPLPLLLRVVDLRNVSWKVGHIPEEWSLATVTVFKKRKNAMITDMLACWKSDSKFMQKYWRK
jgi:hypothetical protein